LEVKGHFARYLAGLAHRCASQLPCAGSKVGTSGTLPPLRRILHPNAFLLNCCSSGGFFTDGKVEIMFKLSYEQAKNLDRLMKGHDL
jgi:hypothetical protein